MSTETLYFDIILSFHPQSLISFAFTLVSEDVDFCGEKCHMIFLLYYNFVSFLIRQGPVSSRGFKVQLEMIELMSLILPA